MRVTIHQPEHLPWIGYFDKMSKADVYVYLDNVQFRKNYFQNRNRIPSGWLTVPVTIKGHTKSTIKDIKINSATNWREKYWDKLKQCYEKTPYWNDHKDKLSRIISTKYDHLVELNYALIDLFRDCFAIRTPYAYASELGVSGESSKLLLDICKHFDATTYLSGPSGKDYLDTELFRSNGVGVDFHEFPHIEEQMSAIDFIMNNKWKI